MAIFLKNRNVPQVFLQLFIIFFFKIDLEQKVMEASNDRALPPSKYALHMFVFLCAERSLSDSSRKSVLIERYPPSKYALHNLFFLCRTKPGRQLSKVSTDRMLPAFEIRCICFFVCRTKPERQLAEGGTDRALPAFEIRFAYVFFCAERSLSDSSRKSVLIERYPPSK